MTRFGPNDFQSPSQSNDEVNSTCVDLACGSGVVELRDSKVEFDAPDDHRLRFTFAEFHAFQQGARAGHTDGLPLLVTQRDDGLYEFRGSRMEPHTSTVLTFNQAEVDAFYHDVHTGRYDTRSLAAT